MAEAFTWSTHPELYVLVRYTPTSGNASYARVTCEWMEPDDPSAGSAMSVYRSPFDAYLDATFHSVAGQSYQAIEAHRFDPSELIHANGGKLHTFMHCGWGAHDGRLIVRRKGHLVNLYAGNSLEVHPGRPIRLTTPQADLNAYDQMREKAGLFAHLEAHDSFLTLCETHRQEAMSTAVQRIPGRADVGHEVNQMALYDPEAEQWHFLPISVFHEACEAAMAEGSAQDAGG